jgi:uncharacterized protein YbbC (DUF1343 family)
MSKVLTGLERLCQDESLQKKIKGDIGLLCHSASITPDFQHAIVHLKRIFGKRLIKLFGPQHGLVTDVQDNMVESTDFIHPYFQLPVYSLYSETRIPTDEMLKGVDTLIVDLQDVGTRVYTYITTVQLLMEKIQGKDITLVILDRPNPVGGQIIEGSILDKHFCSFVGRLEIPQRHGMTMAEVANYIKQYKNIDIHLESIKMKGWKRSLFFKDCTLPWVNPSPNLPVMDGAMTFPGTVLFEGTNLSEGRGTTRSLEVVGHPSLEPYQTLDAFNEYTKDVQLDGLILRPLVFNPAFQKHQGKTCGGFHIHVTDHNSFRPWKLGQLLCHFFFHYMKDDFSWNNKPYEYEHDKLAIDLINGTDRLRKWIETNTSLSALESLEKRGYEQYFDNKKQIELY